MDKNNRRNREEIVGNIDKKHIILMPDGREIAVNGGAAGVEEAIAHIDDPALCAFVRAELGSGMDRPEPQSIKAMRRLELVDYEPASDSGHFRFYPKGQMIFDLLAEWAREIAVERIGAMQIGSPLLYDRSDPEIMEQAGSFHERHYSVKAPDDPEKEFILRFAGDFGLFKIMKGARFSHRMLPVRIYEFSKSFRYEKRGELAGLKRLRAFHMPDVHCFCRDLAQGFEEYAMLFEKYCDLAAGVGVRYAIGFRVVEEFYREHRERLLDLVRYSGRPAFVELLSGMKHYWVLKHEFQGLDGAGGSVQLSTVQLDIKDAAVYGINFVDADGSKKGCIICHSSVGSIERWIYLIIEDALAKDPHELPLWLSPSQVRLVPVAERHIEYCRSIAMDGVRFDIDDRDEPLSKKIARAGMEWVPYVAVVGDREVASGVLSVKRRSDQAKLSLEPAELAAMIRSLCEGFPRHGLPVAKMLSARPVFFG